MFLHLYRPWRVIAALGTAVAACMGWPTPASATQQLSQKNACIACHQASIKLVGPSWKEIGARYGEGKGTTAQLMSSIKNGSSGKWGPMPMPPQAQVPDAELQLLAQWILDGAK